MVVTNFSKAKKIPKVTTKKSAPTTTNFAKGIYTYKPNDAMDYDEIYLAQNARFDRIGEYKTRLGLQHFTTPIGLTDDSNIDLSNVEWIDIDESTDLTFSGNSKTLYKIRAVLKPTSNGKGVIRATVKDGHGKVVGVSCDTIPDAYNLYDFVFKDGIFLESGYYSTYHVYFDLQNDTSRRLQYGAIPGTQTFMRSLSSTDFTGKVVGMFEANIASSSGYVTKYIIFAFSPSNGDTKLYRVRISAYNGTAHDETPQEIRTLPSGVERVRFLQSGNKIRYADGVEGPRIIDPNNNWNDTAIPTTDLKTGADLNIKVSNILEGTEDNIIYFDAETTTQAVWTYPYGFYYNNTPINSYDKFDRDFRQNFPAIQTGDPLTAMFNLGGIVYFLTRHKKYYMYSLTADEWTPHASTAQHGTFSQESCVCDTNYAYYANDDGIYIFDGTSEVSITQNSIQSTYDAIVNKEIIKLELYNNRLYVFYPGFEDDQNYRISIFGRINCLVYNINLKLWESFDTDLPVNSTIAHKNVSNRFFCGSSKFCQLFVYEGLADLTLKPTDSKYSDLGAPIDFDLETSYLHFGTPSQLHRITKWRPEFSKVSGEYGDYAIKCGYALDFTDDVKYAFSINLKNKTVIDEHYIWDNPSDYGNKVGPTKLTTKPQINGQFYRCQIRYQLHSAFTPVNFKSHTLSCETQRLR